MILLEGFQAFLISDSPANPLNFQSIEGPIEGVLESPHKESTCDSRDSASGGSEHSSRRNGSATNLGILSQDSSVPSSSWNNISRGGNVRTSTQPEKYSTTQRLDENQNQHDEHQRSSEELKDMMRSLLLASSANPTPPIPPHRRHEIPQEQEFNKLQQEEVLDVVEESPDFQPVVVDDDAFVIIFLAPTLVEELKEPDPSSGLVELSASEPGCYPLKFSELHSFVVGDDTTVISPCDPLVLNLDQYPAKVKVKLDPLVTDFASDGSTKMRDSVDLSIDHFVPMDECNSFADVIIDAAPKGMGDMIKMTINWIEFDMDDLGTNSGAHKVFDKLSEHDVFRLESNLISHGVELLHGINASIYKNRLAIRNFVFNPGIATNWCTELYSLVLNLVASMLQL